MDWTATQRARRNAVHDASWAEYFTQPRIPEGAVHLIIGDSLIRVRLLDVASMMEHSIPDDAFSDGIHFDRPRVMEWLNSFFQRHIIFLAFVRSFGRKDRLERKLKEQQE